MPKVDLRFVTRESPRGVLGDFARVIGAHPRVRVGKSAPGVLVLRENSVTLWRVVGAIVLFPVGLIFVIPPFGARVTITARDRTPGTTEVTVTGRTSNRIIKRGYTEVRDVLVAELPPAANAVAGLGL